MEASPAQNFQKEFDTLVVQLDELVRHYRLLLEVVKKEKDYLIQVEIENLTENNKIKENLLSQIKSLDLQRESSSKQLGMKLGLKHSQPRLLELAKKIQGQESERLKGLHSTLVLLIERVTEMNRENQKFTESALLSLGLALSEIKNTLGGKKTYARKGKMEDGPNKSGNFVSKEA